MVSLLAIILVDVSSEPGGNEVLLSPANCHHTTIAISFLTFLGTDDYE